jgi:hypothetical protein
MALIANTTFTGNKLATVFHRVLGKCCYMVDTDQRELETGIAEDIMNEYTYEHGHQKTVAMIDWKYPGKALSDSHPAIQYQIYSSENEWKNPMPFFMVVYYLDVQFTTKMFYVIPANVPARSMFDHWELSDRGAWMSPKKFSKFQHGLRNKPWNGEEVLRDENLIAAGLPAGMRLKDLSSATVEYPLPVLDFSWLTRGI